MLTRKNGKNAKVVKLTLATWATLAFQLSFTFRARSNTTSFLRRET